MQPGLLCTFTPSNHWGSSSQMAENFHLLNRGYGSLLIMFGSNFFFCNLISSMTLIISFGFFFFNGGEKFAILYKRRWCQSQCSGPKIVYPVLWKYPPCFHLPGKLQRLGGQFVISEMEPDILASLTWCYNKSREPQT